MNIVDEMANRSKDLSDSIKLNHQLTEERRRLPELFSKLGELAYERYQKGESSDPGLLPICHEISQIYSRIDEINVRLEEIKNGRPAVEESAVSEPAAPQNENPPQVLFCTECGTKLVPGAIFCRKCGKRVFAPNPVQAPVPQLLFNEPHAPKPEPVFPEPPIPKPIPEPVFDAVTEPEPEIMPNPVPELSECCEQAANAVDAAAEATVAEFAPTELPNDDPMLDPKPLPETEAEPEVKIAPEESPIPEPVKTEEPAFVPRKRFCTNCGSPLVEGAPFCPICGKHI